MPSGSKRTSTLTTLAAHGFLSHGTARHAAGGFARLLGRFQHAAAAIPGSAAARVDFIDIGSVVAVALDLIVVGQLFAGLYGANCFDEDASVPGGAFAVRVAAMVDVSRLIAVHARVDHGLCVDGEQKGVIVVRILVLVPRVRPGVAHAIAQVLDDGGALADAARGEHAEAVNGGVPHFEQGSAAANGFFHTAIGALMAA